jgi:hypothetical protein
LTVVKLLFARHTFGRTVKSQSTRGDITRTWHGVIVVEEHLDGRPKIDERCSLNRAGTL